MLIHTLFRLLKYQIILQLSQCFSTVVQSFLFWNLNTKNVNFIHVNSIFVFNARDTQGVKNFTSNLFLHIYQQFESLNQKLLLKKIYNNRYNLFYKLTQFYIHYIFKINLIPSKYYTFFWLLHHYCIVTISELYKFNGLIINS